MTFMENYGEYTVRGKVFRYKEFDKITNSDQAYFIGYMSADGGYLRNKRKDNQFPKMSLTSTDKYLVEHFCETYSPDTSIQYREPRSSKKVNASNPTAEINFSSKMNDTFKRFGIFDYKPNRQMVGIQRAFYSSYILGVMDADGCFVVRHRRDCRTPRLNIHIVSSAIKILENIQRILETELNISSSIYERKNQECYEFRINNTDHAVKFGEWIYSNKPSCYNYKKNKIFSNYINTYYKN